MNLSPIVIVILVAVAGLILLYLVGRKVKPLGKSLAFVCAVAGSFLVTLAYHMAAATHYCHRACEIALKSITDTGEWTMRDLTRALTDFVVGVLVILGESLQVLDILGNIFPAAAQVSLPPVAELSSAVLFLLCSAMFGELAIDCWHGRGLLHGKGKLSRWCVGLLAMFLLIFSDLVNGFFYLYRGKILSHMSTQGMTLYILAGLGLEVSAAAPLAYLNVKQNMSSVVAVLMWFAEKTFETVHAAATFLPDLLDTVALHLSGGEIGVYGKQIERDPHKYPSLFGNTSQSRQVLPGQTSTALVPQSASSLDNADVEEIVVPVNNTTITEVPMNNLKGASLVCVGRRGSLMHPPFKQKTRELRATGGISSSAVLDPSSNNLETSIPGIVDLTPSSAVRMAVSMFTDTDGQSMSELLNLVEEQQVQKHHKAFPSPFMFPIDPSNLVDFVNYAESIKRRLPFHPLVPVVEFSEHDLLDKTVLAGVSDILALIKEDIVSNLFVSSQDSLFARQYGIETQRLFIAHVFVSLAIADTHSVINPSFESLLQDLHRHAPIMTIGCHSEPVSMGKVPKRFVWVPGVRGQAGTGELSDIISQSKAAIDRVMNDPDTFMYPCEAVSDVASPILITEPVRLDDERFNPLRRENALYVSSRYHATGITTRGNGCAFPHHLGSKLLVQAARLIPLQTASLLRLSEGKKSVKITTLFPQTTALEPINSNGRVPAQDTNLDAQPTKAVATTRQKKTTSTRRVARKSKQAK